MLASTSSIAPPEVPRSRQAEPIVGGGALKVEVLSDNGRGCGEGEEKRSRAAGTYVIMQYHQNFVNPNTTYVT